MMNELAQRAQRNADEARNRFDSTHIAREWWLVTHPGGEVVEVFFCPPQTQAGIASKFPRYAHCGVLPR